MIAERFGNGIANIPEGLGHRAIMLEDPMDYLQDIVGSE